MFAGRKDSQIMNRLFSKKMYFRGFKKEISMEQPTVFNPMQIHLLKMFSYTKSEESLDELKSVLYRYYSNKMKKTLNELWDSGVLDQNRLDEINEMDLHKL